MPGSPSPTGPAGASRCRVSREIGAVEVRPSKRRSGQPLFDALDPAIHIVQVQLGRGVVDLHRRQIAFDRGKARLDTVKPFMDAGEIGPETVEDVRFSSHVMVKFLGRVIGFEPTTSRSTI